MRIWDLNPGYLNRQSLLGEHRELHGMVSIFINNKKGYSFHPETLRWVGFEWALKIRHELLVEEMKLRGYNHKSPVKLSLNENLWPKEYIDEPYTQFEILRNKYLEKEKGRIPFPKNIYELWAQHKYSVMARSYNLYKTIGNEIAKNSDYNMKSLFLKLIEILKEKPSKKALKNSLDHMWGYISKYLEERDVIKNLSFEEELLIIQKLSKEYNVKYLLESTALSELMVYCKEYEKKVK